jgi:hypothetical protein
MKIFAKSILLFVLLLSACTPTEANACDSVNQFVEAVSAEDAQVEVAEQIEQPFFSVPAQRVIVNGEDIQVLPYATQQDAESDAQLISPDGYEIGTSMVTWLSTPHFYQCGRLLVIYVGDNPQQISSLENILGPQFAGG